ncbi:MAG: hypothetical protein SNF68_08675 [Rikenellaceae bacterium]
MGKISVKHYLNKKVNPILLPGDTECKMYPIYYYITANRKTIHKPSKTGLFVTEIEFEQKKCTDGRNIYFEELLNAEVRTITKICTIFFNDYDNNKVEKRYRYLFERGFSSKDDIVNGINMYIEFYSKSLSSLATKYFDTISNDYITQKATSSFDISMFGNNPDAVKLSITFGDYPDASFVDVTQFYSQNTNSEILNIYYLKMFLFYCYGESQKKYGVDLPLIEWIAGDLENDLIDFLNKKDIRDNLREIFGTFEITTNFYKTNLVPIINELCKLETQLKYNLIDWED